MTTTEHTTHLQYVGRVPAVPAGDLKPGTVTMWNNGYEQLVLSVEVASPKYVVVHSVSVERGKVGEKVWSRRHTKSFLVGVSRRSLTEVERAALVAAGVSIP